MKRFLLGLLLLGALCTRAEASSCNVTEFQLKIIGNAQVAVTPPTADQAPITTSGVSAQSAAFNSNTGLVRVWCDTQSAVAWGSNPTATTNNMPLSAGTAEYLNVQAGQKAAFILRP